MGALNDVSGLIENSGPALADILKKDGIDVVILVPT